MQRRYMSCGDASGSFPITHGEEGASGSFGFRGEGVAEGLERNSIVRKNFFGRAASCPQVSGAPQMSRQIRSPKVELRWYPPVPRKATRAPRLGAGRSGLMNSAVVGGRRTGYTLATRDELGNHVPPSPFITTDLLARKPHLPVAYFWPVLGPASRRRRRPRSIGCAAA